MTEIKGYLLTEKEEKACVDLVKKMREKKVFAVDFSGCIQIKAKTPKEANDIFWNWVGDLQDKSLTDWYGVVVQSPYFENEGVEMKMEKTNYPNCPTFDMSCPYCLASGECTIDNPMEECDDYCFYNGGNEDA